MPPEDGVLDDFSQDFPSVDEIQSQDPDFLTPKDDGQQQPVLPPKDEDEGRKNREHRRTSNRLESEKRALQEIREANIREGAKLEALSEQRKFMEGLGGQAIDERLITLYGNDENGKKAAQITQSLLEDTAKRARAQALEDFQQVARDREQKIRQESQLIDSQLEDLEDDSGIDFTSNSPVARKNRNEFLDMVSKFSPKDEDGSIREYADFDEVFEVFQQTRKSGANGGNTRQKDLASRGMARGGATQQSVGDKATEDYLKDAGII